ncbi:hypothetical protein [Micromonospora musae]|uniref:hypothetical protein n=1 Tax=Micromonospora musae TaxID=1894970 RepID=UPI0033C4EDDC
MPEPQPEADRPAHETPPGPGPDRESAAPGQQQPTSSPEPPEAATVDPTAPSDAARPADADVTPTTGPADRPVGGSAPDEVAPAQRGERRPDEPTRTDRQAGTDPTEPAPTERAEGTRRLDEPTLTDDRAGAEPVGPDGTRHLDEAAPAAGDESRADGPSGTRQLPVGEAPDPAPRWSGSAPVPPPPPRRRAWGESAEPTPAPPPPEPPEHRVPVDPWAGVDTGGWELPSGELPPLPPLPPTQPYPAPAPTRPYSGPPAPVSPPPQPVPQPAPPPGHPLPGHPLPGHPLPPVPNAPAQQHTARPSAPPPAAAPPAPRPLPPPPAPPKQRRSKRRDTPPPAAPPPGWRAPKGYVPVPVRKRRRWPWLLLLALACCCGCPAYYGLPIWSQYPAHAALPAQVSDLSLRQDGTSTQTARQLETEVRKAHLLAEDTFAGVYTNPDGKQVTVFGGTGFRLDPESAADDEITRLAQQYQLGSAETVDTGVRGRHQRCAVGRADGDAVVVCTSVDHGSIATAIFTRLSLQDSAGLLDDLRGRIVSPDRN